MKKIIIFCICFLIAINAYAQTVIKLKNGTSLEGELIEKTDDYIKLGIFGVTLTYWMDEIESIDSKPELQITIKEKGTISNRQGEASPDTKDNQEISKVIKAVLMAFASNDLNSVMKYVSKNYYDSINGEIINYIKFELNLEERMKQYSAANLGTELTNIQISKLDIKDNEAVVKIEFTREAFNINTAHWFTQTRKRKAVLSKENGTWKIIRWQWWI